MKNIVRMTLMISMVSAELLPINYWSRAELHFHPDWLEFNKFMKNYNKVYAPDDLLYRFQNFANNLKTIRSHDDPNYRLDVNKYADLSDEEFKTSIHTGCYSNLQHKTHCVPYEPKQMERPNLCYEIDWRKFGVVTPVKNQGKCGSCWSFSATGAMESAWNILTGKDVNLSEQQLIDCSTSYGNDGCNGGIMDDAFEYAIKNGMCNETEEPYKGKDRACTKCKPVAYFDGCKNVAPRNEKDLRSALHIGPVSVAIEADQAAFQFYTGGIIDTPTCGTNLDHGVLVVGFGTDNEKDYWLVKNSWGPDWGEDGYVRIARTNSTDTSGMCGIAMQPSFPVAAFWSFHSDKVEKLIMNNII